MITLQQVESQLESIGANYKFWGRAEIVELQHILIPGERIQACLNGRYTGGFATFIATDQRLLLIDKKIFFLTVEDMRYDMINEVDFSAQLFSGTIKVCTPTKTLQFTNYRPKVLRKLAAYIQQRVMQVRHQYMEQSGHVQHQPQPVVFKPISLDEQPVQAPQPTAVQTPVPDWAAILGNQAMSAPDYSVTTEATTDPEPAALPQPLRRNPYMNPPLMTRKRIGRFGPI